MIAVLPTAASRVLDLTGKQIGHRLRRAAVGHVDQIDAGHRLEQLAGQVN